MKRPCQSLWVVRVRLHLSPTLPALIPGSLLSRMGYPRAAMYPVIREAEKVYSAALRLPSAAPPCPRERGGAGHGGGYYDGQERVQPRVVVTVLWMEPEMEVVTVMMVELEMEVATVVGVILLLVMPEMAVTMIYAAEGVSGIEKQNLTRSPCPPHPQTGSIWRANRLTGRRRGA